MIIEVFQFKTKPEFSDEEVLAASKEGQINFLAKQKGYVSRELAKSSEGEWVDITHWEMLEDAVADEKAFMEAPSTQKFLGMMDLSSMKMVRWEVLKTYE